MIEAPEACYLCRQLDEYTGLKKKIADLTDKDKTDLFYQVIKDKIKR